MRGLLEAAMLFNNGELEPCGELTGDCLGCPLVAMCHPVEVCPNCGEVVDEVYLCPYCGQEYCDYCNCDCLEFDEEGFEEEEW